MLLQGVFENARIASWVRQGIRTNDGTRATFACDAIVLGVAPSVGVRWHAGDAFDWLKNVTVARVQECRM